MPGGWLGWRGWGVFRCVSGSSPLGSIHCSGLWQQCRLLGAVERLGCYLSRVKTVQMFGKKKYTGLAEVHVSEAMPTQMCSQMACPDLWSVADSLTASQGRPLSRKHGPGHGDPGLEWSLTPRWLGQHALPQAALVRFLGRCRNRMEISHPAWRCSPAAALLGLQS